MYVYRFRNRLGEVIYVGRTQNIVKRIRNEHFKRGHLPEECYREVALVEYGEVRSLDESKMYELYYIDKYRPKYNKIDIGGGGISFPVPELTWEVIEHDKGTTIRLTKKEMKDLVVGMGKEIEQECNYVSNYLRGKDRVDWLEKLDQEERNEYKTMVYLLERFITNVKDLKDTNIEKLK